VYRCIGKSFTDENRLDMVEAVSNNTGKRLTMTYFHGTLPIDAVCCTKNVVIQNACALPIGYGVRDHRAFVVDFGTHSLVSTYPQLIVHSKVWRLNTKLHECSEAYNTTLEQDIARHRLIQKLNKAHQAGGTPAQMQTQVDKIDKVSIKCMAKAEKRCQK
jgi:hypothetical protein